MFNCNYYTHKRTICQFPRGLGVPLDQPRKILYTYLAMFRGMDRITVGIVSWNTRDLLDQLLASIRDYCGVRYDAVVVDNRSTDGSVEMLTAKYPQVKVLSNMTNRGFSAACNQIISTLTNKYLLLINTDVIVLDGAIDHLYEFMQTHADVAACGPQLLSKTRARQPSARKIHGPASVIVEVLFPARLIDFLLLRLHQRNTSRQVGYVSGAFMMMRRSAIEEIGAFDESFFLYVQEADWCYRARQRGWSIYYVPTAKSIHYGGQSTRAIETKAAFMLIAERVLFVNKHYGRPKARLTAESIRVILGLKAVTSWLISLIMRTCSARARRLLELYRLTSKLSKRAPSLKET